MITYQKLLKEGRKGGKREQKQRAMTPSPKHPASETAAFVSFNLAFIIFRLI